MNRHELLNPLIFDLTLFPPGRLPRILWTFVPVLPDLPVPGSCYSEGNP